jgi:hypothetical protein
MLDIVSCRWAHDHGVWGCELCSFFCSDGSFHGFPLVPVLGPLPQRTSAGGKLGSRMYMVVGFKPVLASDSVRQGQHLPTRWEARQCGRNQHQALCVQETLNDASHNEEACAQSACMYVAIACRYTYGCML